MRLLVLGGAGMLGRAVVTEARSRGWAAFGPSSRQVDIRDHGRLSWAVESFHPTAIVNCAAYTKVDLAEGAGRAEAFAVNGDAVGNVAEAARAAGARLLHVSTDYVFDGRGREPYLEDDPVAPASVYGLSKRVGEEKALAYENSLVVRTSWLFGPGGPNFAATIAKAIDSGRNPLTVVADQRGAPTYTPFLARALADFSALDANRATGLVHYQNREPASWYDFASAIARLWPSPSGATVTVEPVTTAEFPRPAPRPAWSVLSVERCERWLGRRVEPWEQGLALYLSMLRKGNS